MKPSRQVCIRLPLDLLDDVERFRAEQSTLVGATLTGTQALTALIRAGLSSSSESRPVNHETAPCESCGSTHKLVHHVKCIMNRKAR